MFLVEFLRYILELFYSVTGSLGLSIVLLSLAVTIIMLPLFWIAEIIQNKERVRKATMQPSLDEIKDVENKQEKFYYTKEIYRKHQYNPLYALTGLIGLLIQVPFFIAAYWMLLEYLPLQGVSFGPIKDLYQPDGLIAFGGMTFNLLPFVMTFVNLFAGYLYAKKMDKNERMQLFGIAFVFLFLLYNLSAALVLYWTMNNVFAIGKNWLISNIRLKKLERFLSKHLSKQLKFGYFIYPLLFSLIPLLSVYFTNIGELQFAQIAFLLLIISFSTLILLFIAKAIFKDKNKVVLFGILIVTLFFSFGHLREAFLNSNFMVFANYGILGGAYFTVLFLISFFLLKSKKHFEKTTKVMNVLSICLFSIFVIRIVAYNISTNNNGIKLSTSDDVEVEKSESLNDHVAQYPDIYYIVLDGYANSRVLKDKHDFDNSSFDNILEERGFYIAKDSRANYMTTFLSLAATLNMEYINHLTNDVGIDSKDRGIPNQMISDSKVKKYLKNKGYKTVNFRSGWGITNETANSDYNFSKSNGMGEFSTTFLQTTILLPFINKITAKNYSSNVLYALENIYKIEAIKEPKFVFAHIVSPHPPYVFDENGGSVSSDIKLNNKWDQNEKKYYLDQLIFINKKTAELIDSILIKPNNPIIILQSDHGPAFLSENNWANPNEEFIVERSKILNAIYLNDESNKDIYPTISSVNTFRVVLNSVFNDDFILLNDSTFYSSYEKPYDFRNVTDLINKN